MDFKKMSINERFKYLRKNELHLTQIDFGKRLGVAGSTVVGWEKGDRTPSESTIKFICREFDVNYVWLKYGEGDMFISIEKTILDQLANEYKLDDKRKELIERILSFSGDEIKAFEKMGFLILKL